MKLRNWNQLLWEYLLEYYCTGGPVYLCFNVNVLQNILKNEFSTSFTQKEAEQLFMTACNSMIRVYGGKAWIPEVVFAATDGNRSLCLSYAVQQILTAEKMFSDEKYTADAYFPRYRKAMGLLDESGAMPISYEQFHRIWSTLKNELLSLPSVSEDKITFSKGKGKNLNRSLPLSQALLSHENLIRICSRFKNINSYSDHRLLLEVQRNKHFLLKDAQNKIFNRYIKNALIEQIRSFASNFSNEKSIKRRRKRREVIDPRCFELFRNFEGWDDFLQLDLSDKCNGDITVVLEKYLQNNNLLLLTKGLAGEFVGSDLPASITSNEKFVVCTSKPRESFVYSNITDYIDGSLIEQLRYPEVSIPKNCTLFYCTTSLPEGSELVIGNTGLFAENKLLPKRLTFTGGISLNSRTNDFLLGFPPTGFKFAGRILTDDDMLTVNSESIKVDTFLKQLKQQKDEQRYLIKYSNYETTLSITNRRRSLTHHNIGFNLLSNRTICPVSTYGLEDCKSYFKHNVFYGIDKTSIFPQKQDNREINYQEFMVPIECFIPLRNEQIKIVIRKLSEMVPESKYKIIKSKILTSNAVPPGVFKQISVLKD